MKFWKVRPAAMILLLGWLLGSFTIAINAENGDFQTSGNVVIFDMVMEGEYVYIAGSASQNRGSLQSGSLDLSGGLKDIYLAKYNLAGNLIFEALVGGENDDSAFGLVVQEGVMYVLGETWSQQFPSAPGSAGEDDAVIFAVTADGSQIQWARRIGGSDQDSGRAIAIQDNALFITGISWSADLVAGEARGDADGFLARMDLSGGLAWVKVFGGSALDAPYDLALSSDQIWVTGQTFSNNFGGTVRGGGDIFVVQYDQAGNNEFSGLYGSRQEEIGFSIELTDDGSIYISGATQSADFPIAMGEFSGGSDGVLLKIGNDGTLEFAVYLGGSGIDYGYDSGLLPNGDILVGGMTGSLQFPLGFSEELSSLGGNDAFLVQVNPSGQLTDVWQIGGSQDDRATELLISSNGVWLAGQFSDLPSPYLYLLPLENLTEVILPTSQAPVPTATRGVTATPFPTETPVPTITPTPEPDTVFPSPTDIQVNVSSPMASITSTNEIDSLQASPTLEGSNNITNSSSDAKDEISSEEDSQKNGQSYILPALGAVFLIGLVVVIIFWNRSKRQ